MQEFVLGNVPKISIDPRFYVLDSHGRCNIEATTVHANSAQVQTVALYAAGELLREFVALHEFIEVIKIRFQLNSNSGALGLSASMVFTGPLSDEKDSITAGALFYVLHPSGAHEINDDDRKTVAIVIEALWTELRGLIIKSERRVEQALRTQRNLVELVIKMGERK